MRRPRVWRVVSAVVASSAIACLSACDVDVIPTSGSQFTGTDSVTALLGDGAWRAFWLDVSNRNGELIIDGKDERNRRLVITLYGGVPAAESGVPVTLTLDYAGAAVVGVATLMDINRLSAWTTFSHGASGTLTYQRTGQRIDGTFSMVLAPVENSAAEGFRSIWNGRFSLALP